MPKRPRSPRARAEHVRELAEWTSDARTQHILLDLANELDKEVVPEPTAEEVRPNLPPSLS